jgi:hypothetical protein
MAMTRTVRSTLAVTVFMFVLCYTVLGSAGLAAAQSTPAAAATPAESQPAAAPAVTIGASAAVVSAYVWRGFVLIDEVSVQPSVWLKMGGLTLTSWVNVSPGVEGDAFTEHDFTLDYTRSVGRVALSAGYINYFFVSLDEDRFTNELYVGATVSGPLNPSLRVYQDVQQGSGTYVSFGVSQAVPLGSKGPTITPSAVLGYNNNQWVDGSGWSDLSVGATLAFPVNGHLDLSASANYSRSLNKDWFPSKFWGGATLAVH